MKSKKITQKKFADRYFFRIEKGSDLVESINNFCQARAIRLASVNGIGAADELSLGVFNTKTGKYDRKTLRGTFEIVSAQGNITLSESKPSLHMHVVVCDENMQCLGGHLLFAKVSVTFEGVIESYDGFIEREEDSKTKAKVWKI